MPVGAYPGPQTSVGNGVTTVFPYNFRILASADLRVALDGVEQSIGYTVSGVGDDSGGNVTFSVAPAIGVEVLRERAATYDRTDSDYQRNGAFQETSVDRDFDRPVMLIQQLKALSDRTPKLPAGSSISGDDFALPAPGAGLYFRWNNSGTAIEYVDAVYDLGNFLASFTGAVTRSASSKMGDIVTLRDAGVSGDPTDDSTKVQQVLAGSPIVIGVADDAAFLADVTELRTDQTLIGGHYKGKTGIAEFMTIPANSEGIKLLGAKVVAQAGIALHQNSANSKNTFVVGSKVYAAGYGILSAMTSGGSDGFIVAASEVYSDLHDAVEWNHPSLTSYNYTVGLSLITGGPNGSSGGSGFGIGVAGTQGHISIGNHIRAARQQGYHAEDGQRRGISALNTMQSAETAVHLLNPPSPATADGVIVMGNYANWGGSKATAYGVRVVADGNGVLGFNVVAANYMRGYGVGYSFGAGAIQATGVNVAADCTEVLSIGLASVAVGDFYAKGTTTFIEGAAASITGRIISDTAPTSIITKAGAAFPGPYAKGLIFPFTVSHTGGGGAENFVICALPAGGMAGRLTVTAGNGTVGLIISAMIEWDGTTFSALAGPQFARTNGGPSSVTIVKSGSDLCLRFTSGVALSTVGKADFDGPFYLHS